MIELNLKFYKAIFTFLLVFYFFGCGVDNNNNNEIKINDYYKKDYKKIRILFLYSKEASQLVNDIDVKVSQLVESTNIFFSKSDINLSIDISGVYEFNDIHQDSFSEYIYSASENNHIQKLKIETNSDIVTILKPFYKNVCGLAFVINLDKNVNNISYANNISKMALNIVGIDCPTTTLAHEIGHNLGLDHSYNQSEESQGVFKYSRGHGQNSTFSTIMAYGSSYSTTNRIPLFSNPEIYKCSGYPCGIDEHEYMEADAVKSINKTSSFLLRIKHLLEK